MYSVINLMQIISADWGIYRQIKKCLGIDGEIEKEIHRYRQRDREKYIDIDGDIEKYIYIEIQRKKYIDIDGDIEKKSIDIDGDREKEIHRYR